MLLITIYLNDLHSMASYLNAPIVLIEWKTTNWFEFKHRFIPDQNISGGNCFFLRRCKQIRAVFMKCTKVWRLKSLFSKFEELKRRGWFDNDKKLVVSELVKSKTMLDIFKWSEFFSNLSRTKVIIRHHSFLDLFKVYKLVWLLGKYTGVVFSCFGHSFEFRNVFLLDWLKPKAQ